MAEPLGDDVRRDILNRLVLHPSLKASAREAGISPGTIFRWIKASVADPSITMEWLGHEAPFYEHINAARKLNVVALDHEARSLGINGHVEPKFHDGKPVWKIDPVIASDADTLIDFEWEQKYPGRDRSDTYARDDKGGYIQEVTTSPPNPAVLVKLLTSLAPEIYADRSTVDVNVQGRVWIAGADPEQPTALPAPHNFNQTFGLTARPQDRQRPINVLAVPRPCVDTAEFDLRFKKKLVREVVLFRDADNRLMPPLPDDVVIAGTEQHRAFEDAKIPVTPVRAETLIDEGFANDFLFQLAPGYKPKKSEPTPAERKEIAAEAAIKVANAVKEGKASARYDSEGLGRGTVAPFGRKVQL